MTPKPCMRRVSCAIWLEADEYFEAQLECGHMLIVSEDALRGRILCVDCMREILSRVQGARKEMSLGFTERIELFVDGSDRVKKVIEGSREALMSEALATRLTVGAAPEGAAAETRRVSVDGEELAIGVVRLGGAKGGGGKS